MTPPDLMAIDHPLSAQRPLPTSVDVVTITDRPLAAGEAPLQLSTAIEPGAKELWLVDTAALAVGQVVRLGELANQPEYATVAAIDSIRLRVVLAWPTVVRRSVTAPVAEQTVTVGATTPLARDGAVGDSVIFVAHAAVGIGRTIRIRAAGVADEFRTATTFESTTGADGSWLFPPIARVAEVALHVTHAARTLFPPVANDPTVRIAVGGGEQRRDFVLT